MAKKKYRQGQNIGNDKILLPTKYCFRKNIAANKILAKKKYQ
jgi:hypothetical protein